MIEKLKQITNFIHLLRREMEKIKTIFAAIARDWTSVNQKKIFL